MRHSVTDLRRRGWPACWSSATARWAWSPPSGVPVTTTPRTAISYL